MLRHIKLHYQEWDLDTFVEEFDRLAEMDISLEWKDQIHNLIMRTTGASKNIPWDSDFEDDPDKYALRKEYIAFAEMILGYKTLRL
jgi:hypothetical protein